MKQIEVSVDVFAHIWLLREAGENNEDEILKRVLQVVPKEAGQLAPISAGQAIKIGFLDSRHNVQFPEDFEIFRTYLGQKFQARAIGGSWLLSHDNTRHRSLNELSRSIGARAENAWKNWLFLDSKGSERSVADLRDPTVVSSRTPQSADKALLVLQDSERSHGKESILPETGDGTWRDDVKAALGVLGGKSALYKIYRETEKLRRALGRTVPRTLEAVIRRTLEDHSSDSHNYRGGPDLFCMPEGKGAGIWALRS